MKIVIAGGRGFLGSALTSRLIADGHEVVLLTRGKGHAPGAAEAQRVQWQPNGQAGPWAAALHGADAVVNLAGESIAGRRWTSEHKARIRESRLAATRSLVAAIGGAAKPPEVLVSASAVGYYGNRGEEFVTETAAAGHDFLAKVCQDWEEAATEAAGVTRVALVRTGIVLARDGGALPKMARPFYLFAGGPVGSGRQYMPWIHKADWVSLVSWLIRTSTATGPFNATALEPVTNAAFARALGRALHRPSLLPAPGFALRLALGEMADALLLSGQRAVPSRATGLGFSFAFTDVSAALAEIYGRS